MAVGAGLGATPRVSLVVPVFNEQDNLEPLAAEIRAAMAGTGEAYEVLLVDDGSTDGSLAVLRRLAAADPRLRVLRLRRNCGQSAAFAAGFRRAHGEVVVTLDADLQNDPADIPRLLEELRDCDVVCGVRRRRRDAWVRRASSRVANAARNRLTGESIQDVGCSLRACRAELVRDLPMFTGMHRFLPTLLRLQGAARVKEVPVAHRPRLHGRGKYGIGNRLFRALADLFAVRWMQRRWIDGRLVEEIAPPAGGRERPTAPAAAARD
jgi:glycosyltransferase involved in cell wall biosynthesis